MRFIHDLSPRPVAEVSLTAAIGLLAGMAGRAYNVSGTGLNQYVILMGTTGIGKDMLSIGIDTLINALRGPIPAIQTFRGPGSLASGQGLVRFLSDTSSSFVSVIGEIGHLMQRLSSPKRAPTDIELKRVLLDLYGRSGRGMTFQPTAYSDGKKDTKIVEAPAVTLVGDTTP